MKELWEVASDETALRRLRDAFGGFATGVAIMTTRDVDGEPVGVTVNSFASLSLQPPLVMWALNTNSPSLAAFMRAGRFAVNVLAAEQVPIAMRFASRVPSKFEGIECCEGVDGLPLIDGCVAQLECRVGAAHPGGDHVLFVGQVERYAHDPARAPLVFHAGSYCGLHQAG